MLNYSADRLRAVGRAIFEAAGAPPATAARVADSLVEANLTGHDSHGILRIAQYVGEIRAGYLDPAATPRIVRETPVSALVDGAWTFGQVSALYATDVAIERAKSAGVGVVGLVRTNHIGRLGEYTSRAAERGVVALYFAGGFGGPGSAPYGGAAVAYGTNPFSAGFPADEQPDVLVDFATTGIAAGKIRFAQAKRQPLPPGLLADRDGNPTTNPDDYFAGGMLLPMGGTVTGHKGYGLAVAVELLAQSLTGSDAWARESGGSPVYGRSGSLIVALDEALFRPADEGEKSADAFLSRLRAVPPAPGFAEVLVPGDPERRTRESRLRDGVQVPEATWAAMVEAGRGLGVDVEAIR